MDLPLHENPRLHNARLLAIRAAQHAWAQRPIAQRCRVIDRLRRIVAQRCDHFIDAVSHTHPARPRAQTLAAEILPLADACKFAARHGKRILKPRRLGMRGRPIWLGGSVGRVMRAPLGMVLVIGPGNYPLLLPGVQAVQALVAGNAVVLKPGRDATPVARAFAAAAQAAGLPENLLHIADESPAAAQALIDAGVDHIVLTGSAATGRAVLAHAANTLTPVTAELSGSDAMIVRDDADLNLVARAIIFSLTLNHSQTCIAARRILVHRRVATQLADQLAPAVAKLVPVRLDRQTATQLHTLIHDAESRGAKCLAGHVTENTIAPVLLSDAQPDMPLLQQDVFAPIVSLVTVDDDAHAIAADQQCPYALGASIFGSVTASRRVARQLRAGCITINDVIVPTADPRVPFGGAAQSGFGVTRGREGLLAMTRPQTVLVRRGPWRVHLRDPSPNDEKMLKAILAATHQSGFSKLSAFKRDTKPLRRSDPSPATRTSEHPT